MKSEFIFIQWAGQGNTHPEKFIDLSNVRKSRETKIKKKKKRGLLVQYYFSRVIHFIDNHPYMPSVDNNALSVHFNKQFIKHIHYLIIQIKV